MNRILLSIATLSILATGCGRGAIFHDASAPASAAGEHADITNGVEASAKLDGDARDADAASATSASRQPGDFVVYRFSGSFRKSPLTLTERVIARSGNQIIVDMSLDDGKKKREIRVRFNDSPSAKNEVMSVTKLERGAEKPAKLDAYDALMAETTLAADVNEAFLGTEDVKLDLGKVATIAKKTSYRVRVGKTQATLRTLESADFAWGDVGGEITASNGKLLYRAEVIDTGRATAKPVAPAAVASDE